jgi:tetratricopeptide (TPR) repeat protein
MAARAAANLAARLSEHERAAALAEEGLAAYKHEGDAEGESACLNVLARVAEIQGDYVEAGRLHRESAQLSRGLGDLSGVAVSLSNMAQAGLVLGDPGEAEQFSLEALELAREVGHVHVAATCLLHLGTALGEMQRTDGAREYLLEAAEMARQLADDTMRADVLVTRAWLEAGTHPEQAMKVVSAGYAALERAGVPLVGLEEKLYEDTLSVVRASLGDEESAHAWRWGKDLTLDAAEREFATARRDRRAAVAPSGSG